MFIWKCSNCEHEIKITGMVNLVDINEDMKCPMCGATLDKFKLLYEKKSMPIAP